MFRHFVPSRELRSLTTLVRLSLVDLPSANSMKCCSPPASLEKQIPKIRPLTGRTMRKVDGLFLSPKSKKEVNHNDKTENPWTAPSRKGTSRDAACTGTAQAGASGTPWMFSGQMASLKAAATKQRFWSKSALVCGVSTISERESFSAIHKNRAGAIHPDTIYHHQVFSLPQLLT